MTNRVGWNDLGKACNFILTSSFRIKHKINYNFIYTKIICNNSIHRINKKIVFLKLTIFC